MCLPKESYKDGAELAVEQNPNKDLEKVKEDFYANCSGTNVERFEKHDTDISNYLFF